MKSVTVRMKSEDAVEVLLYDVIGEDFFGGISARTFREQVKAIKAKSMNLRINSPGGSVIEGAAMLATLDEWKGTIDVDVDGMAASAASFVMMAGDTIRVASNGLVMIHNPLSLVVGGAEDMRREAELLDKVKGQILDTYIRRSNWSRDDLSQAMDEETWFTGKEAVEAGLADSVNEPVKAAAFAGFDAILARYKHVPPLPTEDPRRREETDRRRAIAARL
ncbi:MAG TPA: head maturation protease, ClpP-related [Gemmataceae bacterium]|nr:head maturation protease, ClpP-related [Gemmataceae bacterium]